MRKAAVFWFTGLSGSGKTTVALGVKPLLEKDGYSVLLLDGDEVRKRLHAHLGFTPQDIRKNNNLIAGICAGNRLKHDAILVPIISPFRESRAEARKTVGDGFYEIYFDAGLDCVVRRDVKGFYSKARRNEMENMIGFAKDVPYEPPESADLVIHSGAEAPEASVRALYNFIVSKAGKGVKQDQKRSR